MNVFDFDGTIYDGDSTVDFYRFMLVRHPSVWAELPVTAVYAIKFLLGKFPKTEFKQTFFRFLRRIKDVDRDVAEFWSKNEKNIKPFYREMRRDDDLIISASPEFLLSPVCRNLIASDVDKKTGIFRRENCYGEEKVRRLNESRWKELPIESFYSDSHSDAPLAALAERAFLVNKHKITEWRS